MSCPSADRPSEPSTDRVYSVLASERCRHVLQYFLLTRTDRASLDELVDDVLATDVTTAERTRVIISYHHVTLPKLDDLGAVEYDAQRQIAQYRGHTLLEQYLDLA